MPIPSARTIEATVADLVSIAFGEYQALRDEMREWADNMSGNNMEHLPKYDEVSEAADNLDGFADNEPDVPSGIAETKLEYVEQLSRRKGRGLTRAQRRDNANAALQTIVDHAGGMDTDAAGLDDWQELSDACEEAIGEAENVSFPGMF